MRTPAGCLAATAARRAGASGAPTISPAVDPAGSSAAARAGAACSPSSAHSSSHSSPKGQPRARHRAPRPRSATASGSRSSAPGATAATATGSATQRQPGPLARRRSAPATAAARSRRAPDARTLGCHSKRSCAHCSGATRASARVGERRGIGRIEHARSWPTPSAPAPPAPAPRRSLRARARNCGECVAVVADGEERRVVCAHVVRAASASKSSSPGARPAPGNCCAAPRPGGCGRRRRRCRGASRPARARVPSTCVSTRLAAAQQVVLEVPLHARERAHGAAAAAGAACAAVRSRRGRSQRAAGDRARLRELRTQLRERRDVIVALDHGGHRAAAAQRRRVQLPHRVGHCGDRGCPPGSRRDSRDRRDGSAARARPGPRSGTRAGRTRGSPRSRRCC